MPYNYRRHTYRSHIRKSEKVNTAAIQSAHTVLHGIMYFSPQQLSAYWHFLITVETLANWRSKHKGPPFVRFGRRILYPVEQLKAWEVHYCKQG